MPLHQNPVPDIDPADLALLTAVTAAVARLDERLAQAPAAVAQGWRARMLIEEAAASARLNGDHADATDLLLFEADALDGIPSAVLSRALLILQMLRAIARRSPRQLFTPRRLIAFGRLRLSGPEGDPAPLPAWLAERLGPPEEIARSLGRALDPRRIAAWQAAPALMAAADLVAGWHDSGAADRIGAAPGRALAAVWLIRAGLTTGLTVMPSVGFTRHAATYRPEGGPAWTRAFLEAVMRMAGRGLELQAGLAGCHGRLMAAAAGRRQNSRMPAVAELLVAEPAVHGRQVAERLGMTGNGARLALDALHGRGLIREISGRDAFRVFAVTP